MYDLHNKKIKQNYRIHIPPVSNQRFDPVEFRQQVRATVDMCSIGRRKLGVFLSGGLDSSMIAYELKKIKGEVNAFTNRMHPNVVTDEDYNSDWHCAEILAREQKFNHTEVPITPQNFADIWDDSIYYMEQPVYNPSMAMYCHTNKVLAQNKIIVTIAGDMGDELLAGYPKYWKMYNKKWLSLIHI